MPIYEYECTSCCTVFEVFQRMTEDPLTTCPDCSGSVKKLMSMSSFQLKGGGWYADGYNSKSCNASGPTTAETSIKNPPGETAKVDKAEKAEKAGSNSTGTPVAPTSKKESCSATT